MTNDSPVLDRVFHCLANSTRRQVMERLSDRPASMSELAECHDMALPSFLQHLRLLEESGLILSEKLGRVRTYRINPPAMQIAEHWLDRQRRHWSARLDQFDELLDRLNEVEKR